MKKVIKIAVCLCLFFGSTNAFAGYHKKVNNQQALQEAKTLLHAAAKSSGRAMFLPERAVKFPKGYNVYLKSVLDIDYTLHKAWVELPLFVGLDPSGEKVYYIITEASQKSVAKAMGVNYSPKMIHAVGTQGVQKVILQNGHMKFKGKVDFSPERLLAPGKDTPFPPSAAQPGALADEAWSSIVVLPSGQVLNAQIIANASGLHDRAVVVDKKKLTTKLTILDGFQDGKQYFYHLVTDASLDVAAAFENGVLAPKLAKIPTFGVSSYEKPSALLGFSPVLNGISDSSTGNHQGFSALLANGGLDPINIFPYGPDNINYSPLWDAHVSQWTEKAIKANKVTRITSFKQLKKLIQQGYVESAKINPEGPGNDWIFGLRPTKAIINCPVISHPDPSVIKR